MKLEIEIDNNVYQKTQEIFGDDVDPGQVLGQMFAALLVVIATHQEEFIAVFQTRQASPEQRQLIDDAMDHQVSKILKRAEKPKQ